MTRILLLGLAPLPFENQQKMYGPGVRTWQFAKPLVDDGHEVCLVASRIPFAYPDGEPPVRQSVRDGVIIHTVAQDVFETTNFVQTIHDDFQPDCVVGATIFPSYLAAGLKTERPLWVDLFGHVMAEAQAKAHVYGSDQYLYHFWNYERRVLLRGDAFSVVSQPQKFATIGELGAFGRLNLHTFGQDFIHSIPCAIEGEPPKHSRTVFRGKDVSADDFVVLWSGGYNTWTDVDSLMAGLERAMSINPHIKFVSTGGQIDGHDELTYPHFLRLIERSRHASNFVMKGWVPTEDVPNYYSEADVGVNIDSYSLEGVLGSRNRILSWLAAGLPVLTTCTSEVSQVVKDQELGYNFPHGDPIALADLLVHVSTRQDELRARGQKGKQYVLTHYTYDTTTLPLRQWVEDPRPAPDRGHRVLLEGSRQKHPIGPIPSDTQRYYHTGRLRRIAGQARGLATDRLGRLVGRRLRSTRYLAKFREQDIPTHMRPCERRRVKVTVVNQSTRSWPCPESCVHAVNLSYRWYEVNRKQATSEGPRSPLPTDLEPGQVAELQIEVRAPEAPGHYTLVLDMVEEDVAWFSDIGSDVALSVPIRVED